MSKKDEPKLKNETLKALDAVDHETLAESNDTVERGVIRHPSHVQVPASSIPRTNGKGGSSTKRD